MNIVLLSGNIGLDPEIKVFESGSKKMQFSLATKEVYMKNGERTERTDWHNIEVRSPNDFLVNNLKKGTKINVSGKLRNEEYEKDGIKRKITKIISSRIEVTGGYGTGYSTEQQQSDAEGTHDTPDDDLPF